ncbi:TraB/GumN family protein [Seonamhaeicola marinus]|uniref:TraB/GumN family protein n=1 Tax=Seonamhaeicola marinus TaxID=1912246 RepID=A0A5D0I6P6_9FLAO|nr:TraB/GumN family protein [Seonamhaeicola marinus]TYA78561.1 TraB/GumN family protein [Seonamhaeicola marinus]
MKLKLTLLLLTVVSSLALNAQKLENSTLWKISGNGLDKPSYLFGTIHITCDATIEADVQKALDETSQVVLEIDMDDPTMQTKMMGGMYMKDGKTIKDFVNEEDYTAIDSLFIKNMGMPIKLLQNVKPFFIGAMLYPKMLDCPMQSFEMSLMKVAKAQNEEILGLETVEEQLQVFDAIPYEEQIKDLVKMAKDNLKSDKAKFAEMLKIYDSEDISSLADLIKNDDSSIAAYEDELLIKRNKNWIPKISEFSKEQPTFYGVGAGHLGGEFGVINLLRQAGYTVTAVQ